MVVAHLAALARAGDPHPVAGEAMDAEVRGDLVGAAELFRRAAELDGKDPYAGVRASRAANRAVPLWAEGLEALAKAERFKNLAVAAALAARLQPNHASVTRARSALAAKGLAPDAPPPEAEPGRFPRGSRAARMRCLPNTGPALVRAEGIVERALDQIVSVREPKGQWICSKHGGKTWYDVGVTALATLAFLSRAPEGLTESWKAAAARAVEFLLSSQDAEGCFGTRQSQHYFYNHSLAARAVAEYAAASGDPARYREALRKAVGFFEAAQNPDSGWRYSVRGGQSDTSLTVRALVALWACRRAGAQVPSAVIGGGLQWLDAMTDPLSGKVGYNLQGGASARPAGFQDRFPADRTEAMTAGACLARGLFARDLERATSGLGLLESVPPSARYPDMYYWELGASAFVAVRGTVARAWYAALVDGVASCVEANGAVAAKDPWGNDGGRVYATAMCILALTAPYREAAPAELAGSPTKEFFRRRTHTVEVSALAHATPAGLYVDAGMQLVFTAIGNVIPFRNGPSIGPEGQAVRGYSGRVKSLTYCCLLGRIGEDGKPFRVKLGATMQAPEPGPLYLLVNEASPEDNQGGFTVKIELKP